MEPVQKEAVASPTVVTVEADMVKARAFLKGITLRTLFEIEDYPIGRNARGRCRLGVEYKRGRGWRTVKQTTDKNGKWCKPHCSIFRDGFGVVITHPEIDKKGRGAAWLSVGMDSIHLYYANGELEIVVKAPCYGKPRRVEERYNIVTTSLMLGQAGEPARQATEHCLKADDPALCDAWDSWERNILGLQRQLVEQVNNLRKAV